MNSPTALEKASEALFGEWCPKKLGEQLGVCSRTIRRWRWSPDEWPMPKDARSDLVSALRRQSKALSLVANEIGG